VNISADAYIKNTTDLLFQQDLPWTSGYWNIPLANIGSMENRGIELMFSTVNTTGEFKWTTDFNIAFNRNKITSLPEDANFIIRLPDAYSVEGPYSRYTIGEPVGSFYGYKFLGVYARDEDVPEYLRTGNPNTHFYGGYPIILDANGDGLLNRDDHVFIGNALPLHTGGFTNTFSYKGFELNIFMAWSYGNMINNMTRAVLESMSDEFNQSVAVRNRWQNQGDVTNIPRAMYQSSSVRDGFSFTDASSRFIEDGSFLRVRNATLAYNIPGDLLSRVKLSSARIYVSGQNLLTFTNYTGLDPENQNTGGGLVPTLGVDYLTQPQPRIYMVGVNLGF
jgi:TonB-dependent starch-binding outer membrane protein SusC